MVLETQFQAPCLALASRECIEVWSKGFPDGLCQLERYRSCTNKIDFSCSHLPLLRHLPDFPLGFEITLSLYRTAHTRLQPTVRV
jgi:hypothetical protein